MERFKQMTVAGAVALALGAPAAWAGGVHFDPDGGGAAPVAVVSKFDWDSGHVLYSGCFGLSGLGAASSCTIYAQGSIIAGQGGGLAGATVPANIGYTFVMSTRATTSDPSKGGTYDGATATNGESLAVSATGVAGDYATSYFRIYADAAPGGNPNVLNGTGYNDGTLILEGKVNVVDYQVTNAATSTQLYDQSGGDNWGGLKTLATNGSPTFTIDVTFVDGVYFKDPLTLFTVHLAPDADHSDNSLSPFKAINPSKAVAGKGFSAADVGTDGSVDIYCGKAKSCSGEFQGDASTVFLTEVVPEPGILALLGIGFAGLAGFARRRQESAAA